jgi:hypothetical protein
VITLAEHYGIPADENVAEGRIRVSAAVTGDGHPAAGSLPLAG